MITILTGGALEQLRTLPAESVHCCVTSPPYWGLRDYGQEGQLGLEKTPEEYVSKMVEVFREVRRVLRKDGTLWLNLGDSYAASSGTGGTNSFQPKQPMFAYSRNAPPGLKPKDLCGIPWRVAFALQADGWWLRSDIIWNKPNPMPESVTDRPTKAHEYLFLLTKSANYFYDAESIKERMAESSIPRMEYPRYGENSKGMSGQYAVVNPDYNGASNRNKRSVWTVATAPYPEAHFATYPPDLIKPCIMAGTSAKGCCAKCGASWVRVVERVAGVTDAVRPKAAALSQAGMGNNGTGKSTIGTSGTPETWNERASKIQTIGWKPSCVCGEEVPWEYEYPVIPCTVLDPFAGSGTTGAVALELGRKAVLIELNPEYVVLIRQRCDITPGLQLA